MIDDDFELPELPVIDKGPPPECPMCGDHPTITQLIDYQEFCGVPIQEAPPVPGSNETEIDPVEVKRKMEHGDRFRNDRWRDLEDTPHERRSKQEENKSGRDPSCCL